MKLRVFLIVASCLSLLSWSAAANTAERYELRIPKGRGVNDSGHHYFTELMLQALRKAANGRAIPALVPTMDMAPARTVRELKLGRTIDIFWLGATSERTRDLLAVPIPLERGLIGYRQFIVRKDRAAEFDAITNLSQLARFKACVGAQWVDADILKSAQLRVVTSVAHESLFKQLVAGRCDYFPRAVHEAKIEMANRAADYPELMVYEGLMLHYPFAVYFFVRHEDQELAAWLQQGLEKMIDDGEFIAFMQKHPHTQLAFPLSNFAHKRLFLLPNNSLPVFTDEKNPRYWFQPSSFGW